MLEPAAAMNQTQRSAWHVKGYPHVNLQIATLPRGSKRPGLAMTPRCQSAEDEGSSASLVTTSCGDTEEEDDVASGDEQQESGFRSNRVFRFQLDVNRGNRDRYGLTYAPLGTALRILSVQDQGAIARWNQKQERLGTMDFAVQEGDLIVQVGDDSEPETMAGLMIGATVRLHIERWPREVTVVLEKGSPEDGFGLGWKCVPGEDGDPMLRICYIGGVLEEWNDKARKTDRPFEVVSLGSRITRVNNFDLVEDMLMTLQSERRVKVAFERPGSWDRGLGLLP